MGPGPFAGMMLADMGAEVLRIDRPGGGASGFPGSEREDLLNRGKRSVALDLKRPEAVEAVLSMVEWTDILIEGYRPGVTERLGLGPEQCHARNPKLVYGRMTGWGQEGPLALTAGHDISYIAITGALHAIGDAGGPPQIPLNLVGDFGGGALYLVAGVLAGLREADRTGHGPVVDAAIVDGVAHLLAGTHGLGNGGAWTDDRGSNMLDGGTPFYAVYETADGKHVAVGANEPKFYAALVQGLGLDLDLARQQDRDTWPETRKAFAEAFAGRTRDEWTAVFDGTDACVAPILSLHEAPGHPQVHARGAVLADGDKLEPGPAPRFSGHVWQGTSRPPLPGEHTRAALADWGLDAEALLSSGAATQRSDDDSV
jgi:alpha-methylacyl-CoA racemase